MLPLPKPSSADPLVVQVLRAHRAKLDGAEGSLMDDMGRRWLQIDRGVEADVSALAQEMARRSATGETITKQMVYRAERYQGIREQLRGEIGKYNKDYAVGTIADAQRQYSTLGIDAAQDAITASYPSPLSATFNRLNVGAVESSIGLAGDGSPLITLLRNDYPDAVDGLTDALVGGIARGLGPARIAEDMISGVDMGLDRALLIARTETARSYRTASTKQYRDSGVVSGFMRLVKKQTACVGCLMRDGERFDVAEELTDHPRGKAELPDNLILSSSPEALITFRYDGDIIVIATASGKFLSVTPEHPILTRRGWVQAALVNESDDVISYGGSERAPSLIGPNENHVPTLAKDLARSFDMFRLGSVPRSAKYLYSDGEGGEVDVIYINRLLWNSFDAARRKQIKQYFFGSRNIGLRALNALGSLQKKLSAFWYAALRIYGVLDSRFSFGFAHVSESQSSSAGPIAQGNAMFFQDAPDYIARHVELSCDCLFSFAPIVTSADSDLIRSRKDDFIPTISGQLSGLNRRSFGCVPDKPLSLERIREGIVSSVPPGGSVLDTVSAKIAFDRVIDIDRRRFSGHVYSFQTKEKWYISNGIISHNCTAIPIVEGVAPPKWEKGEDWFLKQTPEKQREILGPKKYQIWKDEKLPLSDFAAHNHSEIWGSSPRPATIEELTRGVSQ